MAGNYIGLNPAGVAAIPNAWSGVNIFGGAQGNIVGGLVPGAGNVISGNSIQGVALQDSGTMSNFIQGNYLGLNAAGSAAVPNAASGVEIFYGAQANIIGGIGARNFISGNANYGVLIDGSNTGGNQVQGNTIGLNPAAAAVPNAWAGVAMFGGAQSNLIGGLVLGAANMIAGNGSDGIQLFDSSTLNNTFRANSIHDNNGVGIGIYTSANNSAMEAAPNLASASLTTNTTVVGSLTSLPSATFHLDYYASPPPGSSAQARTYLGAQDILTSAGGTVGFTNTLAVPVPIGQIITATATDPAGNTSALSAGIAVTGTSTVGDGIPDFWRHAHFGGSGASTNALSCATCDPDHDGLNNWQEFLAGTDPNNAASNVRAGTVSANGRDIILTFSTVSGITYRVEFKDDLIATGWFLLADQLIGTGGLMQLTNPGVASLSGRYYRVAVLP